MEKTPKIISAEEMRQLVFDKNIWNAAIHDHLRACLNVTEVSLKLKEKGYYIGFRKQLLDSRNPYAAVLASNPTDKDFEDIKEITSVKPFLIAISN